MSHTQRVLSGIQPTGNLHIGNYLGALRNWVQFQKTHECLFCIVDLHALTLPQDPHYFRETILETAAVYIASGIDPAHSAIFPQSAIAAHSELGWLFGCLTPLGWLNRMTQFKEKAGKAKEQAGLGLYAYPVLMAADILLYKATHVPVGEDQKQHIELTRDIAGVFNNRYQENFFPLPEPMILGTAVRVMSLRDGTRKMSKSDPSDYSRISLKDDEDTIRLKIQKAKTDSFLLPESPKDLEGRPEAENLLILFASLTNQSLEKTCQEFSGKSFSTLKQALSDVLIAEIIPLSQKIHHLLQDKKYLLQELKKGTDKALSLATHHMKEIKNLMGLVEI